MLNIVAPANVDGAARTGVAEAQLASLGEKISRIPRAVYGDGVISEQL